MYSFILYNGLLINERYLEELKKNNLADFQLLGSVKGGNILKQNRYRSVIKINLKHNIFYLKKHFWPWKDRIKSLIPWIKHEDARNEWENMILLKNLGFHTMTPIAFGEKRFLKVPCFSFTLTEDIYDAEKLETYLPKHFRSPLNQTQIFKKREFIRKLGAFTREFHGKRLNHQDFYLGHLFYRPAENRIFIVDVQRMHHNKSIRMHDMIKDLAQLSYSAQESGIFTKTDFMRFIHVYLDRNSLTHNDKKTIKKIIAKVRKIARHDSKLKKRKLAGANSRKQ
jgi:hypothetical protein